MTIKLIEQFRDALLDFFRDPQNLTNKKKLCSTAFAITKYANQFSKEPDSYMHYVDSLVKPALKGIRIHPDLGPLLDQFSRALSLSDSAEERQAFHPLTLAYYEYLKKNFLDPANFNPLQIAVNKLNVIEVTIQHLKTEDNPYANELESAYVKLRRIVEEYCALSSTKKKANYVNFERKINRVCAEHKKAIENNVQVKTAFYDFFAYLSSFLIIVGNDLTHFCQNRSTFFHTSSRIAINTLSNFSISVDMSDGDEEETDEMTSEEENMNEFELMANNTIV